MQNLLGTLVIFNENGSKRWENKIVLKGGKYFIQDGAEYSLFPNSEEMGVGNTMGEAIDDFMSKEKGYIDNL